MHRPTHTVLIICPLEIRLSHNTCYLPRLMNSVFLLMILLSQKEGVCVCVCWCDLQPHKGSLPSNASLIWECEGGFWVNMYVCRQKCFNWVRLFRDCDKTKSQLTLSVSQSVKVLSGVDLPLLGLACKVVSEISHCTSVMSVLWRHWPTALFSPTITDTVSQLWRGEKVSRFSTSLPSSLFFPFHTSISVAFHAKQQSPTR